MSEAAPNRKISVDGYRPGDEADILAMNLAEYGPRNGIITPEAFHWRFAQNPAGSAEVTTVRDDVTGRLAGFTWTLPVRMRLYGKERLAAVTANQIVRPEYRDTLAYARMSRRRMLWLRQHGIPFRYNFPTEAIFASVGAAEKMASFLLPLLVRPLDSLRLARARLQPGWLGSVLGWGGRLAAPLYFYARPLSSRPGGLSVEHLAGFDERFDELWQRVQGKYPVMAVRDRAFLSWRFAPVAGRAYHILAASAGSRLAGYAVLRVTDEIRDIPAGLVMDLLLEPGSRGEAAGQLLLAEAWKHFQAQRAWLAGGLAFPHTAEYRAMHAAGYRHLPGRLAPRLFRLAFNCFGEEMPKTEEVQQQDLFFTIADYEAH